MLRSLRASLFIFAAAALTPWVAYAETAAITHVTVPQNGTYDRSLNLRFSVDFSSPVIVTGTPRLALTVGGVTRYARWIAPLGEGPIARLDFEYTPQPFDHAADGIVVGSQIEVGDGSIRAVDKSPANLTFAAPGTNGVRIAMLATPTPQIRSITPHTERHDAVVLSGTADGNSVVTILRDSADVVGQVIAEPNGAWRVECPRTALAGPHTVTATAENVDGVPSAACAPVRVELPTT